MNKTQERCDCPQCKRIDLFESLVNERNFDKLAWFCRSMLNENIKAERLLEIYKNRARA